MLYTILPAVTTWDIEDKLADTFQKAILNETETYNYKEPVCISGEAVLVECNEERNVFVRSIERPEAIKRVVEYQNNASNPHGEDKLNVIVLNFDAVARAHFHRRFPKTRDFITRLHKGGDIEFFEFFRYHVLAPYTYPNLIAMYTGVNFENPIYRNVSTIWDMYKEGGYITASVDNSCLDWSGKYQKHRTSFSDHQFVAPFCLPEVHPLHNPYGNFAGPFSLLRRCLAGDYVHKYAFDYLEQFIEQYPNLPKFMIAAFNEGHEGTGEVIGLVDEDLVKFLEVVDYNNTALFILSDHGLHMSPFYAFHEPSAIKENALGLLTGFFPNWFLHKHPQLAKNIRTNQQSLVTPFEIHETLQHLINFPTKPILSSSRYSHVENNTGIFQPTHYSLFDEIPFSRTCPQAGIPDYFCICPKS